MLLNNKRRESWLWGHKDPPTTESKYSLVFEASQAEPDFAKLFLSTGGPLNTAAGAGATDFALTGSESAVFSHLHANMCTSMKIPLPNTLFTETDAGIEMDVRSKLNICSQRVGAAINGTLVDTHAGAGAVYLQNVLRDRGVHTQVPCTYGVLASHACTVAMSQTRVIDDKGVEVDVKFTVDDGREKDLAKAQTLIEEWAQTAWDMRQDVVYKLSPALTKSVAKVAVGVDDAGYDLVHNVIDQVFPFSAASLNSVLEHTIGFELAFDDDDVKNFLSATKHPGVEAAKWVQTVATACSLSACYFVAYRADGRTVMGSTGSKFTPTESWLRTPMRTPLEANDCDGSGLLVTSMLQAAIESPDMEEFPYLRAVKNAVHPYYTFGIAVLAATSAEASSGGGDTVAGHALALMVPTLSFLDGAHRAEQQVASAEDAHNTREARFDAIFTNEVLASLTPEEVSKLKNGELNDVLKPFAIEGTTPSTPLLYDEDAERRARQTSEAAKDTKVFSRLSPNIARSVKSLHVGGAKASNPHRFYHDFVDLSLHPSHPLYGDYGLRSMDKAASQWTFARPSRGKPTEAGCSPRQLFSKDYFLVPMQKVNNTAGSILDFAAHVSKNDVIPPRPGPMVLSKAQSENLRSSMASLRNLAANLNSGETNAHGVSYTLSYSTLVSNPSAVENMCNNFAAKAVGGVVDFRTISDLALYAGPEHEQAGHFVMVSVALHV